MCIQKTLKKCFQNNFIKSACLHTSLNKHNFPSHETVKLSKCKGKPANEKRENYTINEREHKHNGIFQ